VRRLDEGSQVFFVPADGRAEEAWTWIPLRQIVDVISSLPATTTLLVFYLNQTAFPELNRVPTS